MASGGPQNLSGKVGLVTGAAQGLGLAIARSLLDAGAQVVLADVNPEIEAMARTLTPRRGRAPKGSRLRAIGR